MKRMNIETQTDKPSPTKCGIYGCGRTGTAIAYALMKSGYCRDLVLVDPTQEQAEREAAELSGALPFCLHTDVYAGDEAELADCGVIVTAADCNSPSQAEALYQTVRGVLARGGNPIVIHATAPLESITQGLYERAGLEAGRVLGVGYVTECVRLRKMLGRHLRVNSAAISVFLLGGADGRLAVWSRANVSGLALREYCEICGRGYDVGVMEGLFESAWEQSRKSVYTVAESVRRIFLAIVRDENVILPVTHPAIGHYGFNGISLSMPCIIGKNGVHRVLEIPLDDAEERHLRMIVE